MFKVFPMILLMMLVFTDMVFATDGSSLDKKVSQEYQIGVMVKAIAATIKDPKKPESMQVIVQYGTDSRYYVMIRGWLKEELSGVNSLLAVVRDSAQKSRLQEKSTFLKQAIRRIDLE